MADDEKAAMEILAKEYEWYKDVRDYMEKTFEWSELVKVDREVLMDALMAMSRTRRMLLDVMENNHQDLSNNKSLINDERAKFYNLLFEISHEASDIALKGYLASFPHSDSKKDKDGKTSSENSSISSNTSTLSSLSENSSISSNTEPPEMITRKRKRSPGEEESVGSGVTHPPEKEREPADMVTKKTKRFPGEGEDEDEGEVSDEYPSPPLITCFDDGYLSTDDDDMYHDHSKCHLDFRFDDDGDFEV